MFPVTRDALLTDASLAADLSMTGLPPIITRGQSSALILSSQHSMLEPDNEGARVYEAKRRVERRASELRLRVPRPVGSRPLAMSRRWLASTLAFRQEKVVREKATGESQRDTFLDEKASWTRPGKRRRRQGGAPRLRAARSWG